MLAKVITRFKRHHYKVIKSWYEARGKQAPKEEDLSTLGFVADNRVAGWVYLTNSNVALIEGIIASPLTVPSLRRQSLRKLCSTLVDTAMSLGYTTIIVNTNHPSIEHIATDLGFKEHNLKTFILTDEEDVQKVNKSVFDELLTDEDDQWDF